MQAILMGFSICFLGVMVTTLLFAIAMRSDDEEPESQNQVKHPLASEQFFSDEVVAAEPLAESALEVTLLQLENHVRMEQEAAKLFLQGPSAESLHAPSESPFWN